MYVNTNHGQPSTRSEEISPDELGRLEDRLHGRLLVPGGGGYHVARRVFNAMIDRHPALIIRCTDPHDVVEGVVFARTQGLDVAIKGGGHSVSGNAVCDGGLMLDLSPMKHAQVDRARRTATAQPGLTLGEFDRETQLFGLSTPTGVVSMTGLSGLTLGGGLGWLNGKHGLTCDNLLAAEVVTASGQRITASADEHEDLLWGLRGGGGNFGVVTSFTFRLFTLQGVVAGVVTYPAAKAHDALRLYHEFASGCPDELGANASVALNPDGEVTVSIAVCYAGPAEQAEDLLRPLRRLGPEADTIKPMSYRSLQQMPDAGFPERQQHYWKSGYLTDLDDELIELLLDYVARMPSPSSGVGLQQLHGAAGRVDPSATAFPHRGDRYDCLILSQWPDPLDSSANVAWTRELYDAMEPFFAGGVYVNNLGAPSELSVRQAYGANYSRLVAVKAKYDPTNFFHHNHNVKLRV